jgi:CRISPR-associated RAMP protein (TIGR02581 family)
MLRRLLSQCTFDIRLETKEPLLIKSGDSVVSGPDMTCVRTRRGGSPEPFIPGSSLKGTLRSHAERIARTLQAESVCGVFQDADVEGCSWRMNGSGGRGDYRESCPACRLFGNTHWKGRFRTGDAYLVEEDRDVEPELRDGVGIDRVSGGASRGAKFDLEVVPTGVEFTTRLEIINFECWQLGWMAYVVRDLMEQRIRIGTGTSRGLGRIEAHLETASLEYVGEPDLLGKSLPGIGALVSESERHDYGLVEDDQVERPPDLKLTRPAGSLRTQVRLDKWNRQEALLSAVAPAWDDYIESAGRVGASS